MQIEESEEYKGYTIRALVDQLKDGRWIVGAVEIDKIDYHFGTGSEHKMSQYPIEDRDFDIDKKDCAIKYSISCGKKIIDLKT